jgi:tetratricopeptide (TPR) repeat protein
VLERERTPVFLCRFGRLAMKTGKTEEARQAFLEATDVDPGLAYACDCLGLWYLDQDDPEESLNYFNKSLEIEETATIYTLLGAAQLRLGRVVAARASFTKAIKINPCYEEAYYNLGQTYTLEDPKKSVALFRKAIELDPEYAMAHCELGWTLRKLDCYPEAEFHLKRSLELDDSDGLANVYLGNLLWVKQEINLAEQSFMKAIEVWPDNSLPHWCLAIFYEYQGRQQEADFFYEAALQLNPNDLEANFRFGLFLKQLGEKAKAKTHLERALSSDPMNEAIRTALAELE